MTIRSYQSGLAGVGLILAACSSGGAGPAPDAPAPARAPARAARPVEPAEMRALLEAYAADSMEGREAGTMGNVRATRLIANRAAEIGLEPGGEAGSFFQTVPIGTYMPIATLTVDGEPLALRDDILGLPPIQGIPVGISNPVAGIPIVYAGPMGNGGAISAADGAGKVVVLGPPVGPDGPTFGIAAQAIVKFRTAAAIMMVTLDQAPSDLTGFLAEPSSFVQGGSPPSGPVAFFASARAAELIFGGPLSGVEAGTVGKSFAGAVGFEIAPPEAPARNVIAILRGSDPALRSEYVALGAHNDHIGISSHVVDHDSLRAFNEVVRPGGADSPEREATDAEHARIAEILRGLQARRAPRPDSIANGADDDGSGTVALLSIARAMMDAPARPRRSILFVWHTAEELGLYGSQYFTENPTVPRNAIVAQINVDMIGRGNADDEEAGGPSYLQVIGSRRLSTELGDLVESVNADDGHGFVFDYTYDADGHPQQIYCRSDHYMYARFGIPVAFMSTGMHRDYHQVTDEPQYINYEKLARVARFVQDLAETVANLDHRLVVDGPRPNPAAPCQQ